MRDIRCRGKSIYTDKWITGYYIGTGTLCKYGDEHWYVDDETVGQFTGLFDKNGNRIYEGDVMNNAGNVVGFCNGSFCINGDSDLALWTKTEVIGNIHDNPELR